MQEEKFAVKMTTTVISLAMIIHLEAASIITMGIYFYLSCGLIDNFSISS